MSLLLAKERRKIGQTALEGLSLKADGQLSEINKAQGKLAFPVWRTLNSRRPSLSKKKTRADAKDITGIKPITIGVLSFN